MLANTDFDSITKPRKTQVSILHQFLKMSKSLIPYIVLTIYKLKCDKEESILRIRMQFRERVHSKMKCNLQLNMP